MTILANKKTIGERIHGVYVILRTAVKIYRNVNIEIFNHNLGLRVSIRIDLYLHIASLLRTTIYIYSNMCLYCAKFNAVGRASGGHMIRYTCIHI